MAAVLPGILHNPLLLYQVQPTPAQTNTYQQTPNQHHPPSHHAYSVIWLLPRLLHPPSSSFFPFLFFFPLLTTLASLIDAS